MEKKGGGEEEANVKKKERLRLCQVQSHSAEAVILFDISTESLAARSMLSRGSSTSTAAF